MRLLFDIAFDGGAYHGWQRQKQVVSVQEIIENKLALLFQKSITIYGCGRTDAGVHAEHYYFHIDIPDQPIDNLAYKLNRMLPTDISINNIKPVRANFNSRYGAKSRTYRYYFHHTPDPFLTRYSYYLDGQNFDLDLVSRAVKLIIGKHDFRYFCKTPDRHNTTDCTVYDAKVERINEDRWCIIIKANRFLKSMIRIMAYRLVSIGIGEMHIDTFSYYLNGEEPQEQVKLLAPQGLFLTDVEYENV